VNELELFSKPLFIFEIANNHQGDVAHGKSIISAMREVSQPYKDKFNFAIKFQYRNLKTFIHKDLYEKTDIKNIKRFRDTELQEKQFHELRLEAEKQGFFTVCTPFDEDSVQMVQAHDYDAVKIASCSFTDWPLLEKIARCNKPVIASAAGATEHELWKVTSFFQNRKIELSLMHCVAEYPVTSENLQMNQIDLYHAKYPWLRIGFSTHESPDNMEPIKIAIAKGAVVFEKHVGVPTEDAPLNAYSASPEQVSRWLKTASDTYALCGVKGQRYLPNQKEMDDLIALQRGVFAGRELTGGEKLREIDKYLAFPCKPGQLLAKHLSKYNVITVNKSEIEADAPIMLSDVTVVDDEAEIQSIIDKVTKLIHASGVVVPVDSTCDISHHYGIKKFDEVGVTIINCINREYCKKILIVLSGQRNPEHTHSQKEETFTVLHGELNIKCNGETQVVGKGESKTVERGVPHEFWSDTGCVFEEISTTHINNDSYYSEEEKNFAYPRKTEIYITEEVLERTK